MESQWDVIVIGAGMSGLGAGIRLALAGKKVLLLEANSSVGGLNGYYFKNGIRYDVGLHAMTNFIGPKEKNKPLTKICRQLRIPYESLQLEQQGVSCIQFPEVHLEFSNEFNRLQQSIAQNFPKEIDAFNRLHKAICELDDTALTGQSFISSQTKLQEFIHDETLRNLLLLPLLYYGSAHVNDIDWRQFAILFKAIYCEGFARPRGGVRTIIHLLRERYRALGGILKVNTRVQQIIVQDKQIQGIILNDGNRLQAKQYYSSLGYLETLRLCQKPISTTAPVLSFLETITTLKQTPQHYNWPYTIVFFNQTNTLHYEPANQHIDLRSGVICIPENYQKEAQTTTLRTTHLASYDQWKQYTDYQQKKAATILQSRDCALNILKTKTLDPHEVIAEDIFTPLTVERFTGHIRGAIYGISEKRRDGRCGFENLFLCGTDQGFLGIVGALLSGISMANYHSLQNHERA